MSKIQAAAERDFRGDKNKRMAESIQKLTDLGCTVYRDSRLINGVLSRGYVVLDVYGIFIADGPNLDCAMYYAIYKIETGEDVPDMENAMINTKGGA